MTSHFKKKVETNPKLKNLSFLQSSMQQLHTSITTKSKAVANARLNTTTQMLNLLEKQQEKILAHLLKVMNNPSSPPDLIANVKSQYLENADRLEMFYLNKFFAGESWKFRGCVGQGIFLGFKDVSIDNISAGFTLTAYEGKILFHIFNLVVRFSLGELRIKGNKAANLLGQVFKPKWVDLEVTGEIKIPLKFFLHHIRYGGGKGKWDIDDEKKDGLVFKFHFMKNAQGRVPLPESLINNIVNNFIPKLVTKNISKLIPNELGPLFMGELNRITLRGDFSVISKMPSSIWKAPLLGTSEESKQARRLLACDSSNNNDGGGGVGKYRKGCYGLDDEMSLPEACVELITILAQASVPGGSGGASNSGGSSSSGSSSSSSSGGKNGQVLLPLSLENMHFYYLNYSGPTEESGSSMWDFLINQWQTMLNDSLENFPQCAGLLLAPNWFLLMFKRMQKLARRQMDINFQVMEMDVALDVDYCVNIALDAQFKQNTRAGPEPAVVVHTQETPKASQNDEKKHTAVSLQHELEDMREGKISERKLNSDNDNKNNNTNSNNTNNDEDVKKVVVMTKEEGKEIWQQGNKKYRSIVDPIHHIGLTVDCRIHHISNAQGEDDAQLNVNLANLKIAGDLPLVTTLIPRFQMEYHLAVQGVSPSLDIFTFMSPEGYFKCTANLTDPAHLEDCYCYGLSLGRTSIDILPPASVAKGLLAPPQVNVSLQLLQMEGPLSPLLLLNHFLPHKFQSVFHVARSSSQEEGEEYQEPCFAPLEPFSQEKGTSSSSSTTNATSTSASSSTSFSSTSLRQHPLIQLLCAKAHRIDLSVGMSISLSRRNRVSARDAVPDTPGSSRRASTDTRNDVLASPLPRSRDNSVVTIITPLSNKTPRTSINNIAGDDLDSTTHKNMLNEKPPPPKDAPPDRKAAIVSEKVGTDEEFEEDEPTKFTDFISPVIVSPVIEEEVAIEPRKSESEEGKDKLPIDLHSSPATSSKVMDAKAKFKNQLFNLSQKGTAVAAAAVHKTAHVTSIAAAAAARKISGTSPSVPITQISSPVAATEHRASAPRKRPPVQVAQSAPAPAGGWGMLLRLILSPYVDESRQSEGKCLDLQFSYELGELLSLVGEPTPTRSAE